MSGRPRHLLVALPFRPRLCFLGNTGSAGVHPTQSSNESPVEYAKRFTLDCLEIDVPTDGQRVSLLSREAGRWPFAAVSGEYSGD